MKILYITSEDMGKEGAGKTHFMEVAKCLSQLGNELRVQVPGYSDSAGNYEGVRVRRIPTFKKSLASYLFYEIINVFMLAFTILSFKPQVIYSRQVLLDSMHAVVARLLGVAYVMEKNGVVEEELKSRGYPNSLIKIFRYSQSINLRLSKAVVCVAAGIRDQLTREYGVDEKKIVVIPNGVNTEIFKPFSREACLAELQLPQDRFYVGFVGTFAPWQGLDVLLDAFKLALKKHDDFHLLMIGDGENFAQTRNKASDLKEHVTFFGRVPYKKVPLFINACDLLTFPRKPVSPLSVCSPLKLYEYLSCAKPVVASRIVGVSEAIEKTQCGYVYDADDHSQLALKLIEAHAESARLREMGKKGRALVEQEYTWEITASRIDQLLNGAVCA